ncbi:hypothetical protein N9B05_05310 [Mariniblastus sp.]|nr:hypothetical protein [Mariniblastus sp.]
MFVQQFDLFRDYADGKVTKTDVIEKLVQENISNDAGAAIRCSNAILVFRAAREFDALELTIESKSREYQRYGPGDHRDKGQF